MFATVTMQIFVADVLNEKNFGMVHRGSIFYYSFVEIIVLFYTLRDCEP